jgi:hypothetical protein
VNASNTPKVPSNALFKRLTVPRADPLIFPVKPWPYLGKLWKSYRPSLIVDTSFLGFPRRENEKNNFSIFLFKL